MPTDQPTDQPTDHPGPTAAIVLAGGRGSRLGTDKPELLVDGRRLLDTALDAVSGARIVLVGPPRTVAASVHQVREDPAGGGPAAAIAAALPVLTDLDDTVPVLVLAADLPGIRAATLATLLGALAADPGADGVVLVDPGGRRQTLISGWRLGALRRAVRARPVWDGVALRTLLMPLRVDEVRAGAAETADIDTDADLAAWSHTVPPRNDPVGRADPVID